MDYRLLYHPDVKKNDLPGIPRNIKKMMMRAIEERLVINPIAYGEPLRHSLKGYRKLRVGDYRIIHQIIGQDIIILKIGHRNAVYSQVFSRLSG